MGIIKGLAELVEMYFLNRKIDRKLKQPSKKFEDDYFGIGEYVRLPKELYAKREEDEAEA